MYNLLLLKRINKGNYVQSWDRDLRYHKICEMKQQNLGLVPEETIINKIYFIRGQKVMLDRDLAELYGVETKRLKEAVRRNINRFPEDFMFEMTSDEFQDWRTQFASSNSDMIGLRHAPFCFSEQGVTMLSCVLNSQRAIDTNIRILRVFAKMREMLLTHKEILLKLEHFEHQVMNNSEDIQLIFETLKQLLNPQPEPRRQIGYKRHEEE